jgi:hypothetical protein
MKNFTLIVFIVAIYLGATFDSCGQVGIGTSTPHTSAMLEVKSSAKGLLIPRMTTAQRNTLGATATAGLMVYDTDLNRFYYYTGSGWMIGTTGDIWSTDGTDVYLSDVNDFVGIGTNAPARKFEINSGWYQAARISTAMSGSILEFVGSATTDWAAGSWDNSFRLMSSPDDFANKTEQYLFTTSEIYPFTSNSKTLGLPGLRWSNIFSTNGDFSGNVGIGTTSPARPLEVHNPSLQTARFSSETSGAKLEFIGTSATDFGIGTWGNSIRITSSTDEFASISTDEYYITTSELSPWTDNAKTLGSSTRKWSNIFGVLGSFTGPVGIGTTSPVTTLEVAGTWKTARLSSTGSGSMLEFASSSSPDFAIGTWGNSLRIFSSTDDFSTTTDEYYMTTSEFSPWSDNARTLGSTTRKWSNIYGVLGSYTGTVSIGTTSHLGNLVVHDGTNTTATVYITPETTGSGDSSKLILCEDAAGLYGMYWLYDGSGNEMELWGKSLSNNYGPHILVKRDNGYMAIGTTFASGYRLSVEGKIICTELRVNLVANWPDYVFKKDYALMPIEKLGDFIDKNGHLPNIPAASEIEKSGMDVGEMQKKMMEKIEELSLYILQQQEQIRALQDQVAGKHKPKMPSH